MSGGSLASASASAFSYSAPKQILGRNGQIEAAERRREPFRIEHDLGIGELQAVLQLGVRLAPVLAADHHAELRGCQRRLDIFVPVLGKNRDAIAAPDAVRRDNMREPVHAVVELRIAPDPGAFRESRAGTAEQHHLAEQRSDGDVRRRIGETRIEP